MSGPIDFVVFNSCESFSISVALTSIVSNGLSKFKSCTVGILDTFSLVNTLAKTYLVNLLFHYLSESMCRHFSGDFLLMTLTWSFV